MRNNKTILLVASAATLALALHQGALAEPPANNPVPSAPEQPAQAEATPAASATSASTDPVSPPATGAATGNAETAAANATAPAATAPIIAAPTTEPQARQEGIEQAPETARATPVATKPAPPPEIAEAHERMEQRRAEIMQERKRRYNELRERAAEVGLELPETPPWDQPGMQRPLMPARPELAMPEISSGSRGTMTPEERDARREQRYQMMRERATQRGVEMPETPPWKLMSDQERQAHFEKMRNMTAEERQAMRDQHWQDMRQRAQERGIEMPETPPWKQAEQRRAEMKARWESYRETFEAMTQEQKEAAQAIFGPGQKSLAPQAMGRQAPPRMPMQAPYGQQGAGLPPGAGLPGSGFPGYRYGRGHPMNPGPAQGWYGGDQGGFQGPPPPAPNFNQR